MAPTYSRVLAGSDGSDRAGAAVARAVDVAATLGASLTVLGVGRPDTLQETLEGQVGKHADQGVDIEVRIESGHAAQILIDVAQRDGYDLLVVGDKGMRGIERLMLGSVPNQLSHHLPCSLLIVKTG